MIKAYVPNNLLIIIQIFLSITTIIVFIYNNCILKIIKIIKPIKDSDISSHEVKSIDGFGTSDSKYFEKSDSMDVIDNDNIINQ